MDELPTGALEGLPVKIDKSYFPEDKKSRSLLEIHNDWSSGDKNRELAYLILQGMDYAQSRDIPQHPEKFSEGNPILGPHPSMGKLNNYTALTMLGHLMLANYLPPDIRRLFQSGSLGLEAFTVANNKKVR